MADTIKCPSCGTPIKIADSLAAQVEEDIKKGLEAEYKKKAEELEKKALKKAEEENALKFRDLEGELAEKKKLLEDSYGKELALRKKARELEEEKARLDVEIARRLDEERKSILSRVEKDIEEKYRLKQLETEKQLDDTKKALADAQRKAQQGSMQTQGEVLELDFENTLSQEFKNDEVIPVAKGVTGADIKQTVKSPIKGVNCGTILWELKHTKTWSDGWIDKLKNDLRSEKANVAVIVSTALPPEADKGMFLKDGVWICTLNLALPLAYLLRKNLLDVAYQKATVSHRGDKADMVYEYITGHEFQQQVEALVEVYKEIHEQIAKERAQLEKSLKTREAQAERLISGTVNIYGTIQGRVGAQSMPQVKGLEFPELEEGSKV